MTPLQHPLKYLWLKIQKKKYSLGQGENKTWAAVSESNLAAHHSTKYRFDIIQNSKKYGVLREVKTCSHMKACMCFIVALFVIVPTGNNTEH